MKKFFIAMAVLLTLCGCEKSTEAQSETVTETSSETTKTAAVTAADTFADKPEEKSDFLYVVYNGKISVKTYNGSENSVVIPEEIDGMPVTKYYYNAFEGSNVKEITFPSTITDITKISGADSLETLNLPKTLKSVTPRYLADCPDLRDINIENGGDFMSADGVLYSADGKTLVCFPAGRTGEFTVPDGVEIIGDNAFTGSKLTKVTLPKGVVGVEKYAFYKAQLTEIILPEGLAEIDNYAFADSGLKNIVLPAGLSKIGNSTFSGCQITEIALPEGLSEIGVNAFSQTNLTELYLPDSVESCGDIAGGNRDIAISAPLAASYGRDADRLLALNVTFRGDNDMYKAMRAAPKPSNDKYYSGRIFIDINGDKFPEMISVEDHGEVGEHYYYSSIYRYDTDRNEWVLFWLVYNGENINLYYDKANNEYFYLLHEQGYEAGDYFYKKICTVDCSDDSGSPIFGFFDEYSIGERFYGEYIVEEVVDFGSLNGKYYIGENEEDFLQNAVKDAMSEYDIVFSIDIAELIPQELGVPFEITVGDLADTPQASPYFSQKQEKEPLFTIGQEVCTEDTFMVYLDAEDATPENFEKLSLLPKLTTLSVGGRYGDNNSVDLNGIGVLTNLRELHVWGNIKNAAEIGKLKNLSVLYMSSTADDFTFLTGINSLVVMEFDDTTDKPEDFYEPLYGMKNMRCLLLSTWDNYMTAEQYKHIKKNAPHIKIFMYKRG